MKKRLLVLGSTAFVSASSFADNTAVEKAINDAVTTGQSNYGLVVVGLIGLAAIGFGLRAIMNSMGN
ncbi:MULTISPECIES: hypothetical protein [Vibrio]|uniref:Major coat protein Gp8 n=1 Tax=Vibrio crassostreae TaxID=246167 RepID=A0ABM9QWD0_9VIBR|nr:MULTISPECIES: hypothetical protein [Vibrio]PME35107.1 hypothetical protein BCV39_18895 [Vibrio sp. 10N.286.55.E10]PME37759.1 hypothetical protein BCV40_05680 [Vibrio sp. 10N.286.55.E12]PME67618.1 hypothetical protein BCV32_14520 [Vibrio sp. 10N.286.55.C11]TCL30678.1 hypothetical protein EDB52_101965 [Vibrio crassostreae]TCT53235.1 hypothetical protein EDB39_101301 [Vibrio crassostreae]